jgi:hypothetical protein
MGAQAWRELFNGRDLLDWRGLSDDGSHDWCACGAVSTHPDDAKRFDIRPGTGVFVNGKEGRTENLRTEATFGDCELHIEFVVPEGSNSGVYLMGRYEVQVLDSWGATELTYQTCGAIYARWIDEKAVGGAAPRINASRPPGEWQTYDVIFRAPRFDGAGEKTGHAIFERVAWNGEVVHENVEVQGPTRAPMSEDECPSGPLMLQGDHGPVAYRDIRLGKL